MRASGDDGFVLVVAMLFSAEMRGCAKVEGVTCVRYAVGESFA